nr:hypothetical protein GCM10020092_053830 [Actinoplanes digitatis]
MTLRLAARLQADVVWAQPAAPGAQEVTELTGVRVGHAASVPPGRGPEVGPTFLGNRVRPNRLASLLASSVYRTDTPRSS